MFPIDNEQKEKDFNEALAFVKSVFWSNAKTYENTTPHEYIVVRSGSRHRAMFKKMFLLIEKYGEQEKFFGKPWLYLYLGDGYKYFAANGGGWQEDRIILNRAKADKTYGEQ